MIKQNASQQSKGEQHYKALISIHIFLVFMGSYLFSNQDFSAKGVVKGVCLCGVAPETTPEAKKSRLEKKYDPMNSRMKGINLHYNAG